MDGLVDEFGLAVRAERSDVSAATFSRGVRRAKLVKVLQGTYLQPARAGEFWPWLVAVGRTFPGAVLLGLGALEAHRVLVEDKCPGPLVKPIVVSHGDQHRNTKAYVFTRRRVPEEHVVVTGTLAWSGPVYTAVELMPADGGAAACDLLRCVGSAGSQRLLAALREVVGLFRHETDYSVRRRLMGDLAKCPWSVLEIELHRALGDAGIFGWRGNYSVQGPGWTVIVDVAFREAKVAIEADGRAHHDGPDDFRRDRTRWNHLGGEGWIVIRFTWAMVGKAEPFIDQLKSALLSRGWISW